MKQNAGQWFISAEMLELSYFQFWKFVFREYFLYEDVKLPNTRSELGSIELNRIRGFGGSGGVSA